MKTDKELLMLAAKAAGLVGIHERAGKTCYTSSDGHGGSVMWNPLTDDCDALRLAVDLDMEIDIGGWTRNAVFIIAENDDDNIIQPFDDDKHAATRRAIVRAAAAIGEQME